MPNRIESPAKERSGVTKFVDFGDDVNNSGKAMQVTKGMNLINTVELDTQESLHPPARDDRAPQDNGECCFDDMVSLTLRPFFILLPQRVQELVTPIMGSDEQVKELSYRGFPFNLELQRGFVHANQEEIQARDAQHTTEDQDIVYMSDTIDNLSGVDAGSREGLTVEIVHNQPLSVIKEVPLHFTEQNRDEDLTHVPPHRDSEDLTHDGVSHSKDSTQGSKLQNHHQLETSERGASLVIMGRATCIALDPSRVQDRHAIVTSDPLIGLLELSGSP